MKKIIQHLSAALALIFVFAYAQAQGPRMKEKREKIESMKVGFLTQKLNLSPTEAKAFWPVYNQYENDLEQLRMNRRAERKSAREDLDGITDKEIEKLVDGEILFKQQELDLRKKYHAQFKQLLPIKKVALLYRAEEEFKKELLQKLQERRGNN